MSRDITPVNCYSCSIQKEIRKQINQTQIRRNKYISFVIYSGLVLFLEEDHYVAEDFLHLLALMQRRANELCVKCNILSLGTYLKTFNYYTYANVNKVKLCVAYTLHY